MDTLFPSAMNLAFGGIGALMAIAITFFPFQAPRGTTAWHKSPKVRALLYAGGGGALVTFFGDLKKIIGPNTEIDTATLFAAYCISFVFVFILISVVQILFINFKVIGGRNLPSTAKSRMTHLLTDFLYYGYPYYTQQYNEALAAGLEEKIEALESQFEARNFALALALQHYDHHRKDPNSHWTHTGIGLILNEACAVVRQAAPRGCPQPLDIRANYMLAKPYPTDGPDGNGSISFAFDDLERYSQVLRLERYNDDTDLQLMLPIDLDSESNKILPGAPEVFQSPDSLVSFVDINSPDLFKDKDGIPEDTKKNIVNYFADMKYLSFMSIKLKLGDNLLGVLNIETNQTNMFGPEYESGDITNLAESLQPYAIVLSLFILPNELEKPE